MRGGSNRVTDAESCLHSARLVYENDLACAGRCWCRCILRTGRTSALPRRELLLELADDFVRIDIAGNDDERVPRLVVGVEEANQIVPRDCAERRRRVQTTVRVRAVNARREDPRGELRRLAQLHLQVRQRALPLCLELIGRERRVDEHIRGSGPGCVDVGLQRRHRQARPIRSCTGEGLSAHAVERLGDLQRCFRLRASPEQRGSQVSNAVLPFRIRN